MANLEVPSIKHGTVQGGTIVLVCPSCSINSQVLWPILDARYCLIAQHDERYNEDKLEATYENSALCLLIYLQISTKHLLIKSHNVCLDISDITLHFDMVSRKPKLVVSIHYADSLQHQEAIFDKNATSRQGVLVIAGLNRFVKDLCLGQLTTEHLVLVLAA